MIRIKKLIKYNDPHEKLPDNNPSAQDRITYRRREAEPLFDRNQKRLFKLMRPSINRECYSERRAAHSVIAEIEHVHTRLQETINGMTRRANNRLVFVKGSIEHHRHACQFIEI